MVQLKEAKFQKISSLFKMFQFQYGAAESSIISL